MGAIPNQARQIKSMKMAELVSLSGVCKPTITSYVKLGLLPPPEKVSSNLYLYADLHLSALMVIRQLRKDGLSLEEIKGELTSLRATSKLPGTNGVSPSLSTSFPLGAVTVDKAQKIVENAIRLFCVHGFENVTISDITNSAQMGKGTFYLYFKDKRDLLYACFEKITTLLPSLGEEEIITEPDLVLQMKIRWMAFHMKYPHFPGIIQLLQSYLHANDPAIRRRAIAAHIELIKPVKEDIIRAQEEGVIAMLDPELLAQAVLGVMQNVGLRLTQDTTYKLEQAADALEELMRRLLKPVTPTTG